MMRPTLTFLACSSLLLSVSALEAQTQTPGQQTNSLIKKTGNAGRDARSFRKLQVPGPAVADNVKKLRKELHWYSTLNGALSASRSKGKPVLRVHALGDLDGFL